MAQLVRSRIGWLASLVMVSLISSGVIGIYEDVLAQVLALTFFMPLVIGTGGNAGTQAATMMIRSMSIGDVSMHDWFRAFARELLVGVLLGAGLGLLGLGLGMFRGGFEAGLVVFDHAGDADLDQPAGDVAPLSPRPLPAGPGQRQRPAHRFDRRRYRAARLLFDRSSGLPVLMARWLILAVSD